MKTILYKEIVERVARMCVQANLELPSDMLSSLKSSAREESFEPAHSILDQCIKNAEIALKEHIPICQDTGFAVFFIELGVDITIKGGMLTDAVRDGMVKGYREGRLRSSIVIDPVFKRENTKDNSPPIIHLYLIPGDTLKIIFMPKGAGSENMSAISMLKPSDGETGIIDFVVKTVVKAGANPCPPTIVGVGIGGTSEMCLLLAKKALLRPVGKSHHEIKYAQLEKKILKALNSSGIGPQGLGGETTALAVHIETFPCHIASLPVGINLNCHAARHTEITF